MATVDYGHYIAEPLDPSSSVVVKAGSPYRLLQILRPGDAAPESLRLILEEGANASVAFIILPGADASVSLRANLTGRGANIDLSGIYLCGGSEKVSISTEVRHLVPETTSNQLVNGIASGSSQVKFAGRIVVAPDAQKTEAFQTNHNILLSEGAKVDTKPQLEIYADDVKCSHGATIGRLDDLEQFYMRSRGIPEEEAKVLQLISFLSPALSPAKALSGDEDLAAVVENALRSII